MDLEQARAILEVDPETDADQVRRAYLRAVKRHPPERDPAGFQEVREAYELLRAHRELPFAPSASAPLIQRFWSEPDAEKQDALFEQLLEEHPDDPGVRWIEYDRAAEEDAPEVARRSGDPHILREAMHRFPDSFTDEELVRSAEADLHLDVAFAELMLARGLEREALTYASAERAHDIAGLMVALRFLANGQRDEGTELAERWLAREKELVPRRWETEASSVLLAEQILALPESCPDVVVERLAEGTLALDLPPVDELLAGLGRRDRRRALDQLRAHVPQLVHHVAPAGGHNGRSPLDEARERTRRRAGSGPNLGFLAVVAALGLFRMCGSSSDPAPRIDPSMFRPLTETSAPAQRGPSFARRTAEGACMRSLASCEDLRAAAEAMGDETRCEEAAEHLRRAAETDPYESAVLGLMDAELRRLCPGPEPAMSVAPDGGLAPDAGPGS